MENNKDNFADDVELGIALDRDLAPLNSKIASVEAHIESLEDGREKSALIDLVYRAKKAKVIKALLFMREWDKRKLKN